MPSWQVGPVLRGIRGHRAAAILVAVQLGIGLAITVIAVLIGDYFVRRNDVPTAGVEYDLTRVELQLPGRSAGGEDVARRRAALLTEIRNTPDCVGAAVIRQVSASVIEHAPDEVRREPTAPPVRAYALEAGVGIATVGGLQLRAGHDFTGADLDNPDATAAIISSSLARALWPDRDPLGATFHSRSHGVAIVVGVADDMHAQIFGPRDGDVIFAKDNPRSAHAVVLARSAPGRAGELRAALRDRLRQPGQHAQITPVSEYSRLVASPVGTVVGILATIVGAIVLVILIGSMGLTYFLVAARTREIGLRRAMGATRRDVVRSFLLENVILTVAGLIIGLSIVGAALPMLFYEQEGFAIRWSLVAIAVVAIVGLNLLATLIPARKAATVPPVVASRTV
jgi:putative ABC transport system permease protein